MRRRKTIGILALALVVVVGGSLVWWDYHERHEAALAFKELRLSDAQMHINRSLRLWPWSASKHLLAARIARMSDNYPDAEAHLNRYEELARGATDESHLEWMLLRAQNGDIEELETGLHQAVLNNHPQSEAILQVLAWVSLRDSRVRKTRYYLNLWLKRDPEAIPAWYWLGVVNENQGAREKAIEAYEHAVALAPHLWVINVQLAGHYLAANQPDRALECIERIGRDHAEDPEVLSTKAQVLLLKGEEDAARDLLDRALAQHPDHVRSLTIRGRIECEAARPAAGEPWLKRAAELDPRNVDLLYQYYLCLRAQKGKSKEAAQVRQREAALEVDLRRMHELLGGGIDRAPNNVALTVELADLFRRLGQGLAAVDWYYRALRLDPNCNAAHEALAQMFAERSEKERESRHRQRLAELAAREGPRSTPGPR